MSRSRRTRALVHLAKRFFGDLRPGGASPTDEAWARSHLLPGELALWFRMSGADRRHAAGVARRVETDLAGRATRAVLAAALLHDVGKVEAGIGPWRRALARVAATAFGPSRVAARPGRWGRYLRHAGIGRDLLVAAGSDPLTATWAAEHHLPAAQWTLPRPIAVALKTADDD